MQKTLWMPRARLARSGQIKTIIDALEELLEADMVAEDVEDEIVPKVAPPQPLEPHAVQPPHPLEPPAPPGPLHCRLKLSTRPCWLTWT